MKNVKGFSILSVLILASVVAGVALIVMNTGQQVSDVKTKFYTNIDYMEFDDEIKHAFLVPKNCTASLRGTQFNLAQNTKSLANPIPGELTIKRGSYEVSPNGEIQDVVDSRYGREIKRVNQINKETQPVGGTNNQGQGTPTGANNEVERFRNPEFGKYDLVKIHHISFLFADDVTAAQVAGEVESIVEITAEISLRQSANEKMNQDQTQIIEKMVTKTYQTKVVHRDVGGNLNHREILFCGDIGGAGTPPNGQLFTYRCVGGGTWNSGPPDASCTAINLSCSDNTLADAVVGTSICCGQTQPAFGCSGNNGGNNNNPPENNPVCSIPNPDQCTIDNFAGANFCVANGHLGKYSTSSASCPPGPGQCYTLEESCTRRYIKCHPEVMPNC